MHNLTPIDLLLLIMASHYIIREFNLIVPTRSDLWSAKHGALPGQRDSMDRRTDV